MSDHPIVAFIEARYAEISHDAAHAAFRDAHWSLCEQRASGWGVPEPEQEILAGGKPIITFATEYGASLAVDHVLRHDPASVLADLDSKRALLAALEDNVRYWSSDDHTRAAAEMALEAARRHLAAPFASHPDYLAEWSVC